MCSCFVPMLNWRRKNSLIQNEWDQMYFSLQFAIIQHFYNTCYKSLPMATNLMDDENVRNVVIRKTWVLQECLNESLIETINVGNWKFMANFACLMVFRRVLMKMKMQMQTMLKVCKTGTICFFLYILMSF